MKILRIIGITLKWFLISFIVLLSSVLIFLSFDFGKKNLVNFANTNLKGEGYEVKIEKLSSFFPLVISIDRAILSENGQDWLDVAGVTLTLNTWQVITKKHVVASLSGEGISLTNLPKGEEVPLNAAEQSASTNELLSLPVSLSVKMKIHKIHVGAAVAGQDIDLSLKGMSLTYNKDTGSLQAKLPLLTKSFGSPLNMLIKAEGTLDNFEAIFALKTASFLYNDMSLQDISLKGSVTGLPFKPHGSMGLNFVYDKIKGILKVAELTTKDQTLSIKGISLKGLSADIQSNMSYNLETAGIQGSFTGSIRDLTPLSTLGGYPVSGTLNFKGDMKIAGDETAATFFLQGNNLKSADFSIVSLTTNLKASDFLEVPTVLLNLGITDLESSGIKLETVTAKSNLKKGIGSFSLQGQGKELELEVATDLKLTKDRQEIRVNKLGAIYDKQPFKLLKPFDLIIAGDVMNLSPATLNVVTFPFTFQGQLQGDQLDFAIKGDADLGLLSQLFLYSGDIIQGLLHVDFKIKGTTQKPDLDGVIELTKGSYENVIYGTKLYDLHLKATAKNDLIILKDIKAQDGQGGHLLVSGQYDKGKKTLDFKADIVDMRFAYTDQLKVIGREGHFKVKGPLNNVLVSGNLKMGDISYNITMAFVGSVAELNVIDPSKPQKAPEKKSEKSPDDFHMKFDLTIDIPPIVSIYGLGLDSTWGGNLKVSNTLEDILLTGEIKLEHGQLDFLSQRIDIEEGLLTFDGQEDNIPYLALQAGLRKKDFKAIVALNGRASKPTFALSSEPAMPKDEVLSQLLFGSKSSKLSPLDALKLAKVAAELSGIGSGGSFTDIMKDQMGKEEVTVEGGDNQKEATFLSKDRLMDKVHVRVDQGVKATDSKVVVDIDVTDNISVSTESGAAKSSESLGLNYRIDY